MKITIRRTKILMHTILIMAAIAFSVLSSDFFAADMEMKVMPQVNRAIIQVSKILPQLQENEEAQPILFGEREGRIAKASIGRDPLFFFSALSRHLEYPSVPRIQHVEERVDPIILDLRRKIELLENRVQLLQEELKGGINLERFYVK